MKDRHAVTSESAVFSVRNSLLGLASWAVPFAVSFLFYGPDGLMIPQPLFKSLMVVLFGGLGAWLLVVAFRRLSPSRAHGLTLGLFWLVINLVLDLLILLPMTGMDTMAYFQDIGLRYLLIPITASAIGAAAGKRQ